jgi:hypothetical protein
LTKLEVGHKDMSSGALKATENRCKSVEKLIRYQPRRDRLPVARLLHPCLDPPKEVALQDWLKT